MADQFGNGTYTILVSFCLLRHGRMKMESNILRDLSKHGLFIGILVVIHLWVVLSGGAGRVFSEYLNQLFICVLFFRVTRTHKSQAQSFQ